MTAQTEPVDVLAVMDGVTSRFRHPHNAMQRDFIGARAAIAELIEAATEVDRLSRGIGDWSDEKNVERAVLRQRAALARVGGGT